MPKSVTVSMQAWFQEATASERDGMTALQLDYQFMGDNLGNMWWIFFQKMGFVHRNPLYELPESAPAIIRDQAYTANEIYEKLDQFAIPQLWSPYQEFPPEVHTTQKKPHFPQEEAKCWWRNIRDELIFQKFHDEIKGFKLPPSSPRPSRPKPHVSTFKRKVASNSKDGGAELFMHRSKRGRTSKRKGNAMDQGDEALSLAFPTLTEYTETFSKLKDMTAIKAQEESFLHMFDEWKFQMDLNNSLLFYGVGSKRVLLNQFATGLEEDGDVITIDGFHAEVNIESILDVLVAAWLRGRKPPYNKYDVHLGRDHIRIPLTMGSHYYPLNGDISSIQKAIGIARILAEQTAVSKRPYYLVLHNIDGVGLRNPAAQEALASLVHHSTTPRGLNALRLVASVDHVNAPALLWDSLTCHRFQWVWKQVDTHRPYTEEMSKAPRSAETHPTSAKTTKAKRIGFGKSVERGTIFNVLSSLAPRHTEALQQLAGLQAGQMAKATDDWVGYKDLWRQCQRKCIVREDNQLRMFLKELCDHGVVEQSTDDVTSLSYKIPYPARILKQILDFERKST